LLLLGVERHDALGLFNYLPTRKGAFQPTLPVEIDRRPYGAHDHELDEERAVEDEGAMVAVGLEPLSDDVRAAVDSDGEKTRRNNWRESHYVLHRTANKCINLGGSSQGPDVPSRGQSRATRAQPSNQSAVAFSY
jgi:hypothetical protein